jgi:ElaB/YqjD/DUF883 family membrane-anchored ribosome-binding protein
MKNTRTGLMDTPHTEEIRDNLSEVGSNLRKAVSNTVPAAREVLSRISDDVSERTTTIEEAVTDYIREKPLNALLLGAGVGLVLGYMLRRR